MRGPLLYRTILPIMASLDWLSFGFRDLVDIFLVSIFLYYIYKILKTSGSKPLLLGIVVFLILWILVSQIFNMQLMGRILDKFVSVGFIVLVIIFQDDIRKLLTTLGSSRRWRGIAFLFNMGKKVTQEPEKKYVAPIVLACMNMSRKKIGALIAVENDASLDAYRYTGETFKAEVNARLIENIFFKNSPLHDGAMIISSAGEITAAGCILPVSSEHISNKDLGLRHRSALGLSQETDALIIIVSEERGKISLAQRGELSVDIDPEELRRRLQELH